jgi:hypothetical protein
MVAKHSDCVIEVGRRLDIHMHAVVHVHGMYSRSFGFIVFV